MAPLGIIGGLASTGMSIYGQSQADKAQKQAAFYNNKLAGIEAQNLQNETREQISRKRIENRAFLSQMKNKASASGLRTDTGANLLAAGEAAGRFDLEIADKARKATIQENSIRAKGKMGIWESKMQSQAAKGQMFATAIGGLGSAFSSFNRSKYEGAI